MWAVTGKSVVIGATGLAGQAICAELRRRGQHVRSVARRKAEIRLDLEEPGRLAALLVAEAPDLVINCAGLVDIDACESDPWSAWKVNTLPLVELAEWSYRTGRPFIQMSTDHFFQGDGRTKHDEGAHVTLVNQYAKQKLAAECFALNAPMALVLRTSIVGIRGWKRQTFAEWAISSVLTDAEVSLFHDAYTSSIDVHSFAISALDLLFSGASGRFNLGSSMPYSKEEFVLEVAKQLGRCLTRARSASVQNGLGAKRADSLGLDVSKAEHLLRYRLPLLHEIVSSVLGQLERRPT